MGRRGRVGPAGNRLTAMVPPEQPNQDAGGSDDPITCDHCGAEIDTSQWYPVRGRVNGGYVIYHFCSVACRDAWFDRPSGDI